MKKKITGLISYILKEHKLITVIFLLGLFLRLLGTYPGYPLTHPDEPTIGTPSIRIAFEGDFRPQNYYYGSLLSLIYAVAYIVFFIPLSFIFTLPNTPANFLAGGLSGFFDYLQKSPPLHEQSFWSINYWARYDSAIISSLTVIAAYLLGTKLFNKPIALITAFLIAINYRHVLSSRLILADAPAALFALLAVFFCIKILQKGSLKTYILSGFAIGLALSVKYFVYILPAFFISHLFSTLQMKDIPLTRKIINLALNYKLYTALLVAAIVFFVINPYFIIAKDEALYHWQANSARYGLGKISLELLQKNNFSYYAFDYLIKYGLGVITSVLIATGLLISVIRYFKSTVIILSIAVPFIYTFLVISGTGMVRNYSAIIPFLLFFAGVTVYEIAKTTKKIIPQTITYICLLTVIGYQSLNYSLVSGYNLSKEQNMISLHNWMRDNLPKGTKILGPSGIFYPTETEIEATKLDINRNNLLSIEEIKEKKFEWLILSAIPAEITENLLLTNNKNLFSDNNLKNQLTDNFYNTLIFNELADYRVVEFAKPFTQDPQFMIVKIPNSWEVKKDKEVVSFDFEAREMIDNWRSSFYPVSSYNNSSINKVGLRNNNAMQIKQSTPHCNSSFQNFYSPEIKVEPNKWYSLSSSAKRIANPAYRNTRSGFFRLDFYKSTNELVKTYVTKPLSSVSQWQELNTAGFSTGNTGYARISFQIDSCLDAEEYLIDNVSLFSSNISPEIDKEQYKFFNLKAVNFFWLPQL